MSRPLTKIAVFAAVMGLMLAAVGPVAAAGTAGNDELTGAGNQALSIGVQQGANSATVAVSTNGSAVENATVTVTANSSYNGTGTYMTDAAGTVSLPLPGPNETVSAEITAVKDNRTGTVTVTLQGNAGRGPSFVPRGQRVAAFVHALKMSDGTVRIGPLVSSYVHAIVPSGHAAANSGPPTWLSAISDSGPPIHATQNDGGSNRGPPAHAKNGGDDKDRGPPDHAKQGGHGSDEDEENDEDDEGDSGNSGEDNGPKKGNGKAHGHDK